MVQYSHTLVHVGESALCNTIDASNFFTLFSKNYAKNRHMYKVKAQLIVISVKNLESCRAQRFF